jgi:hypothetical protein
MRLESLERVEKLTLAKGLSDRRKGADDVELVANAIFSSRAILYPAWLEAGSPGLTDQKALINLVVGRSSRKECWQ